MACSSRRLAAAGSALWLLASGSASVASELAPLERAWTLAFAMRGDERRAYLVTSIDGETLEGVELGTGDAFAALDAQSLAATLALARSGPRRVLAIGELLPVIEGSHHVAAGANYAEHGAEVDVAAPFLFPKLAAPDAARQRLASAPDWLLDYEVEIALVFDRELASEADLEAARAGVFLANDFTERAQLALEADLSRPGVGGGFAGAKGKPGFLPTGPFLVVPRDWRDFVRSREIRLRVNGEERQRARGSEMIWSVDEILRRALALAGQPHFAHEGRALALVERGIPRGMAVLTGTPGGVVFRTPGAGFVASQAARWAFGLSFLDSGVEDFVKRRYVEQLRDEQRFLRPGDVVVAEGDALGSIETRIEARAAGAR